MSNGVPDQASHPAAGSRKPSTIGFELPLLLFGGFRSIIDELHAELARRGHPDLRPAHGFALQAIGPTGATATETGHRLGITKQAAGKTIDRLAELGYVHKADDDTDRRRKLVRITPRGLDALAMSAAIFDDIRSRWAAALGPGRLVRTGGRPAHHGPRRDVPPRRPGLVRRVADLLYLNDRAGFGPDCPRLATRPRPRPSACSAGPGRTARSPPRCGASPRSRTGRRAGRTGPG